MLLILLFFVRMAKSPPELPALRSDKLLDRMSEGGLADNNNNYNADNAEAFDAKAYNGDITQQHSTWHHYSLIASGTGHSNQGEWLCRTRSLSVA